MFGWYPIQYTTKSWLNLKSSPGFGAWAVLILNDAKAVRKKYVFEVSTSEGAGASFYLSASDHFTMSIKDVRGDVYPLEAETSFDGIPMHEPIIVGGEVGIREQDTLMTIYVGESEIGRRILPFRIDLGSRNWARGGATIGADSKGENCGAFVLSDLLLFNSALDTPTRFKLVEFLHNKNGGRTGPNRGRLVRALFNAMILWRQTRGKPVE